MRRLCLALAALLLLSGCAAIEATIETEDALHNAGFRDASVWWFSEEGVDYVAVSWLAGARTEEELHDESLAAAGVLWRVAPIRFDAVYAEPNAPFLDAAHDLVRVFPRSQLEQSFGSRPRGLDRSVESLLGVGHYVRWAAFGAVLFLLSSALIVWLVLRSSRRRHAAAV